ncbi:hypothetical protein RJ55_01959 [Drechmeria coniospora]|nr:hypothetical protein RJ55_01959 [Drechmeria coniospora]
MPLLDPCLAAEDSRLEDDAKTLRPVTRDACHPPITDPSHAPASIRQTSAAVPHHRHHILPLRHATARLCPLPRDLLHAYADPSVLLLATGRPDRRHGIDVEAGGRWIVVASRSCMKIAGRSIYPWVRAIRPAAARGRDAAERIGMTMWTHLGCLSRIPDGASPNPSASTSTTAGPDE